MDSLEVLVPFLFTFGKVKFFVLFACSKVKLTFVKLLFIVRESS